MARGAGGVAPPPKPTKQVGFLRQIAPGLADALGQLNQSRDPDGVDQLRTEATKGLEIADQILNAKTPTEKRNIILQRASEIQQAGGDNSELLRAAGDTPAKMDLQAQKAQLTARATLQELPAITDVERLRAQAQARAELSVIDPNALVALQRDEAVQRQEEARRRAERRAQALVSRKQRIFDLEGELQDRLDGTVGPDGEVVPVQPQAQDLAAQNAATDEANLAALATPQESISVEELSQPITAPQPRGSSLNIRDAFQDELKAQEFVTNARSEDERTAAKRVLANATARREKLEQIGAFEAPVFEAQSAIGKLISDQQVVASQFGADSEQARAIGELVRSEQQGEKPTIKDVAGIRKEFTSISKDFITMSNAVRKVNASPNTGAGDIALVFNYMKILDPNSVVRESEFATAEQTVGIPIRVVQAYNKAVNGQRLAPSTRQNFKDASNTLFDTVIETQIRNEESFRDISVRANIDPRDTVTDFIGPEARARFLARPPATEPGGGQPVPTQQFQEGQTAIGASGEAIVFRGGRWQRQ